MPELKRRTPCPQCPFRKESAPGYLGAAGAQEFLDATLYEAEMPCHMAINYSDRDWKENQYPTADLCVGAVQFLNNWMKLPRSRKLADACREVGENDKIMSSPEEFMERHDNDMNRMYIDAHNQEPEVQRGNTSRPD